MGEKYIIGGDGGTTSWKFAVETEGGKYLGQLNEPEPPEELISREPVPNAFMQDANEAYLAFNRGLRRVCEKFKIDPKDILGVGIGARMHGLIPVDKNLVPTGPELMWNFSASDYIRQKATETYSLELQKERLLGGVGNFWGPKFQWGVENIPGFADDARELMLLETFVPARLTDMVSMTRAGASETMLFDPRENKWSELFLGCFGINPDLMPSVRPNLTRLGFVSKRGALESCLLEGTPIADIGGDQQIAALGLGAYRVGDAAFTGGTSGVEFVVTNRAACEKEARVNTFIHSVPEAGGNNIYGILACLNAAGNTYRILRDDEKFQKARGADNYDDMNRLAATIQPGSNGLTLIHYTNGGERTFGNKGVDKFYWEGLDAVNNTPAHRYRAALESIASWYEYAATLIYGMGQRISEVRVANDGLTRADLFCEMLATLLNVEVKRYETTGARGALKGARVALLGESLDEAYKGFEPDKPFSPNSRRASGLSEAYHRHIEACQKHGLIAK